MKAKTVLLSLLLPFVVPGLEFREIYSDHMVLQSGMPIRICGTAAPNEELTGRFQSQPEIRTRADEKGNWQLEFPALPPGGPYSLTVRGRTKSLTLSDLLIGEVWICAGQSNMEYPLWSSSRFWRSIGGEEAARNADDPQIRFLATPRRTQLPGSKKKPLVMSWKVCSPQTISDFSAVGFYFGRQLRQELQVPVGLIGCYWSGTRIEPWISESAFRAADDREMVWILDALHASGGAPLKTWPKSPRFRAWERRFFAQADRGKFSKWQTRTFHDQSWEPVSVPSADPIEKQIDGAVLYRKEIELPVGWRGKELLLSLGTIDDCDEAWFNGIQVGATGSDICSHWEIARRYPVPAEAVRPGRNVIAVRVIDFTGEGGFTAPAKELYLSCGKERLSLAGTWRREVEFVSDRAKTGRRPDPISRQEHDMPSAIFRGMVAPWTVLPVRGVIWYQGEANATEPEKYALRFPRLIEDWRRQWKNPHLAFLYVQLSSYLRHTPWKRLPEDAWRADAPGSGGGFTLLREVQAATLALPDTGMAVTIDIGDHSDIHPQRKEEVGCRLAGEAKRVCYGGSPLSAGPRFRSMRISGDTAVLEFENVGAGLTSRGPAGGFTVAGADGRMYRAQAEIRDGHTIAVRSPDVKAPRAVRYAWNAYPGDANIFTEEGLPLGPFRTDSPFIPGRNPALMFDKSSP